jgi:hypothetical protein
MRTTLALSLALLSLAAAPLAGCGGDEPPQNPDANPGDSFLPLVTGATWTYRITDSGTGAVADKTNLVGPLEDVGGMKAGTMAFKVTTDKLDGQTVSWQERMGNLVIRHREQSFDLAGTMTREEWYDPYKLRLDESPEHVMAGAAAYVQSYNELVTGTTMPVAKSETWTVLAVNQSVTVPAGTFECLVLRRTGGTGAADKTYYFARGVGKVKEEGGQLEELVSFNIP